MHSTELLLLLFFGLLIWFWQDSARAKEIASTAGARACARLQLVFLDETVEFTTLRLRRDRDGQLRLQRHFRFEFSTDGSQRYGGRITMLGRQLESLSMDPYRDEGESL